MEIIYKLLPYELKFSFVLMVSLSLLVRLTLNWSVGSAVRNEFSDDNDESVQMHDYQVEKVPPKMSALSNSFKIVEFSFCFSHFLGHLH